MYGASPNAITTIAYVVLFNTQFDRCYATNLFQTLAELESRKD